MTPTISGTPIVAQSEIDAARSPDIDTIGIEFEYPVGENGDTSTGLRDDIRAGSTPNNDWHISGYTDEDIPVGYMGRDHTGAEITSVQLNIQSTDPEVWYAATIERAEDMGYPHAAMGRGQTNFGLHLHLSEMSEEKARRLYDMCRETWMQMFICTSIGQRSRDPWRHGGVPSGQLDHDAWNEGYGQRVVNSRSGTGHYEWRLPEPMTAEHFACVMHFLRLFELDADEAEEYARGLVASHDRRVTSIDRYIELREDDGDFPHFDEPGGSRASYERESVAEDVLRLMGDAQ